jgi:hypothetical protein
MRTWKVDAAKRGAPWYPIRNIVTGAWVAQVPDVESASTKLIESAPLLLESLKFLVEAADTEPGMAIYRAHIEQARERIGKCN